MDLESKRKLRLKNNLYRISLISFVVVIIWIGLEIYWSYTSQEESNLTQANLEDIQPEVYQDFAIKLNQRQSIPVEQLERFKNTVTFTQQQVILVEESPDPDSDLESTSQNIQEASEGASVPVASPSAQAN